MNANYMNRNRWMETILSSLLVWAAIWHMMNWWEGAILAITLVLLRKPGKCIAARRGTWAMLVLGLLACLLFFGLYLPVKDQWFWTFQAALIPLLVILVSVFLQGAENIIEIIVFLILIMWFMVSDRFGLLEAVQHTVWITMACQAVELLAIGVIHLFVTDF